MLLSFSEKKHAALLLLQKLGIKLLPNLSVSEIRTTDVTIKLHSLYFIAIINLLQRLRELCSSFNTM